MPRFFASSSYRNTSGAKYNIESGGVYRLNSTIKNSGGKPESMTTLNREDGGELSDQSFGKGGLPTGYDVTVSGGRNAATNSVMMDGGIRTTTVITQRVTDE